MAILRFVLAASAGVALIAALQGYRGLHSLGESAIPAAIALLAWRLPFNRRIRASLASAALMVIAMLVVHIFGTIEAHFLFFIMVPVVALYEDWAPFATATVLVFAHHGAAAFGEPRSVYNHQAAIESPFTWSLIHSGLFLGICITSIVHSNIHEKARTREKALMERLRRLAHYDPLTGLPNRELFDQRLGEALEQATRTGESVALLMVDVDDMKRVNDAYGHGAGDQLLKVAAQRLRDCVRHTDTAARLGGDEFAVVLPGTGSAAAARTAQRIIDIMAEPILLGGADVTVGASVGVAATPSPEPLDQLARKADQALYAAKRSGRGRYHVFGADHQTAPDFGVTVNVRDALDWALYTRRLREEIAAAKEAGVLPAQTRAPDSARRTLGELTASIGRLSPASPEARLSLPERHAMEEFTFHHDLVQAWADTLSTQSILAVTRPASADRFWSILRTATTGGKPGNSEVPGVGSEAASAERTTPFGH